MNERTPFGEITGILSASYYAGGGLRECRLGEKNVLCTPCGELVPQYGEEDVRRKFIKSLSFYPGRALKSVVLEEQAAVQTPLGKLPAELVTFYESGEVKRVFPRNGKISAYWTEDDERNLVDPMFFDFSFGAFCARIAGICFYKSGAVRSLTLYPGETVRIATPAGPVTARTGFSLYETGKLRSVEPASPVSVKTPAGTLDAFDENATGICADSNSLAFGEDGQILSCVSSTNKIVVLGPEGTGDFLSPVQKTFADDPDAFYTIPLRFDFYGDTVRITGEEEHVYALARTKFHVISVPQSVGGCPAAGCAACQGCAASGLPKRKPGEAAG
jgi:hypothetical protein